MGILQDARNYVEAGYSVIPIRPRDKRPLIDWDEYQTRLPTDSELVTWFDGTENNIGIVTGEVSNLFAVDVDSYKGGNEHTPYPTGMVSKTARGGRHFFYTYSDEIRNKQGIMENVDVRGEGGYVVVSPSVYADADTGEMGTYEWVMLDTPATMPPQILAKYKKTVPKDTEDAPETLGDDSMGLLAQVLTQGFTEGQHNEQLHRLARLLARQANNPALARQVSHVILETLDQNDPTPQEGFDATFQSAWEYEESRLQKTPEGIAELQREIRPVSIDELLAYDPPPIAFNDGQRIRSSTTTMVVGQRNNGKTLFMIHAAMTMAEAGYKIAYIMTEDAPYFFGQRIRKWEELHGSKYARSNMDVWRATKGQIWQLLNKEDVAELIITLKNGHYDFVFFDPLIEFTIGADEQSAQSMGTVTGHMNWIKNELGCGIVVSHHAGKDVTKGARGSSALEGSPDTVILIRQPTGVNQVHAICTKERNGVKAHPCTYVIESDDEDENGESYGAALTMASSIEEARLAKNESDSQILKVILEAGVPLTPTEIVDAADIPRATVYRRLPILVEQGILVKHDEMYTYNPEEL